MGLRGWTKPEPFDLEAACPYQIRYRMPSKAPSGLATTKQHAHGLGPIGGGGFFFALHQMLPAPVDYTGPINVDEVCPAGFAEIAHQHSFGQNAGAAFLSWLILVNAYHESNVEFQHAALADTGLRSLPLPQHPQRAETGEVR